MEIVMPAGVNGKPTPITSTDPDLMRVLVQEACPLVNGVQGVTSKGTWSRRHPGGTRGGRVGDRRAAGARGAGSGGPAGTGRSGGPTGGRPGAHTGGADPQGTQRTAQRGAGRATGGRRRGRGRPVRAVPELHRQA